MVEMRVEASELSRRIDEVLYYVWDPIGVSREARARGEYTSYVPAVRASMEEHSEPGPIADYLAAVTQNHIGLTPSIETCQAVAKLLLEHQEAIAEGRS